MIVLDTESVIPSPEYVNVTSPILLRLIVENKLLLNVQITVTTKENVKSMELVHVTLDLTELIVSLVLMHMVLIIVLDIKKKDYSKNHHIEHSLQQVVH